MIILHQLLESLEHLCPPANAIDDARSTRLPSVLMPIVASGLLHMVQASGGSLSKAANFERALLLIRRCGTCQVNFARISALLLLTASHGTMHIGVSRIIF